MSTEPNPTPKEVDSRAWSLGAYGLVARDYQPVAAQLVEHAGPFVAVVGRVPVAVVYDPAGDRIRAYRRDGGGEPVTLARSGSTLVSVDDGQAWDLIGDPVDGSTSMEAIPVSREWWFAWAEFHPDTGVYRAVDATGGVLPGTRELRLETPRGAVNGRALYPGSIPSNGPPLARTVLRYARRPVAQGPLPHRR